MHSDFKFKYKSLDLHSTDGLSLITRALRLRLRCLGIFNNQWATLDTFIEEKQKNSPEMIEVLLKEINDLTLEKNEDISNPLVLDITAGKVCKLKTAKTLAKEFESNLFKAFQNTIAQRLNLENLKGNNIQTAIEHFDEVILKEVPVDQIVLDRDPNPGETFVKISKLTFCLKLLSKWYQHGHVSAKQLWSVFNHKIEYAPFEEQKLLTAIYKKGRHLGDSDFILLLPMLETVLEAELDSVSLEEKLQLILDFKLEDLAPSQANNIEEEEGEEKQIKRKKHKHTHKHKQYKKEKKPLLLNNNNNNVLQFHAHSLVKQAANSTRFLPFARCKPNYILYLLIMIQKLDDSLAQEYALAAMALGGELAPQAHLTIVSYGNQTTLDRYTTFLEKVDDQSRFDLFNHPSTSKFMSSWSFLVPNNIEYCLEELEHAAIYAKVMLKDEVASVLQTESYEILDAILAHQDCETLNKKLGDIIQSVSDAPENFKTNMVLTALTEAVFIEYDLDYNWKFLNNLLIEAEEAEQGLFPEFSLPKFVYDELSLEFLRRGDKKVQSAFNEKVNEFELNELDMDNENNNNNNNNNNNAIANVSELQKIIFKLFKYIEKLDLTNPVSKKIMKDWTKLLTSLAQGAADTHWEAYNHTIEEQAKKIQANGNGSAMFGHKTILHRRSTLAKDLYMQLRIELVSLLTDDNLKLKCLEYTTLYTNLQNIMIKNRSDQILPKLNFKKLKLEKEVPEWITQTQDALTVENNSDYNFFNIV